MNDRHVIGLAGKLPKTKATIARLAKRVKRILRAPKS